MDYCVFYVFFFIFEKNSTGNSCNFHNFLVFDEYIRFDSVSLKKPAV
jgi:hypothetical protein